MVWVRSFCIKQKIATIHVWYSLATCNANYYLRSLWWISILAQLTVFQSDPNLVICAISGDAVWNYDSSSPTDKSFEMVMRRLTEPFLVVFTHPLFSPLFILCLIHFIYSFQPMKMRCLRKAKKCCFPLAEAHRIWILFFAGSFLRVPIWMCKRKNLNKIQCALKFIHAVCFSVRLNHFFCPDFFSLLRKSFQINL